VKSTIREAGINMYNTTNDHRWRRQAGLTLASLILLQAVATPVYATVSQTPAIFTTPPDTNVMFTLDDSGSMSSDAIPDYLPKEPGMLASDDANSGVFFRCQDPAKITDETCYEANIFDQRPDPTYGTGAIVRTAPAPSPMPKAGGKWNTYEITARGTNLVLLLNGQKTVDVQDAKFANGPIALRWGRGTIKFRKVEIKAL
jgi:hypothetical protein